MENMLETNLTQSPDTSQTPHCRFPSLVAEPMMALDEKDNSVDKDLRKPITPDRLKVPKPFKYPERYNSPTDMMVSPITKVISARRRKSVWMIPPGRNQPKIPELSVPDESVSLME